MNIPPRIAILEEYVKKEGGKLFSSLESKNCIVFCKETGREFVRKAKIIALAEAMYRLKSPYALEIFGIQEKNEKAYLLMERILQGSLEQLIKSGKNQYNYISEEKIWDIAAQISITLNHFHMNSIYHKGLRPCSIYLSSAGFAKLDEFVVLQKANSMDVSSPYSGSIAAYQCPELINGQRCTNKADMFSFGAILFEIGEQHLPFESTTIEDLNEKILTAKHRPFERITSPRLQKLITQLLHKLPKKRPSASDLLQWPEIKSSAERMKQQAAKKFEEDSEIEEQI
ncbi:MAG: putative CAMK family protein kinase [Streblomastix strix]|uniref:Putative CAMK family protein kinase n=1 Tax=Streblomastix strix TaxID=222440 RepID=A0A5J4X131_9EUKA|nr:MAG: putative CAMK family protein kinase [Streblomastix strix]